MILDPWSELATSLVGLLATVKLWRFAWALMR
jgi:hypothetical protein